MWLHSRAIAINGRDLTVVGENYSGVAVTASGVEKAIGCNRAAQMFKLRIDLIIYHTGGGSPGKCGPRPMAPSAG